MLSLRTSSAGIGSLRTIAVEHFGGKSPCLVKLEARRCYSSDPSVPSTSAFSGSGPVFRREYEMQASFSQLVFVFLIFFSSSVNYYMMQLKFFCVIAKHSVYKIGLGFKSCLPRFFLWCWSCINCIWLFIWRIASDFTGFLVTCTRASRRWKGSWGNVTVSLKVCL